MSNAPSFHPAPILPLRQEPTEAMRHEIVRQLNAAGFRMMVCAVCGVTENDGSEEPGPCGEAFCIACASEHMARCAACHEAYTPTPEVVARVAAYLKAQESEPEGAER